jgi:hypothetical protein
MSTRASILVRTPRLASARVDEALCMCGSGRTHRRCHGLRGSERRHRGCELHALAELHDLALLFPSVRPKGAAIESFADRLAASMGDDPRDSTPAEVEEGVRLLPGAEQRRLVRVWATEYPDRWRTICSIVGEVAFCEHTLVSSAVRAAVADRVVCPSGVAAELEDGALEGSPGAALALALAPSAVWSYEEVMRPDESPVTGQHMARVRRQAGRLHRRLPFAGLPRASSTLLSGCDLVAADEDAAAAVAGLLLEAYGIMLERRASYISQRN